LGRSTFFDGGLMSVEHFAQQSINKFDKFAHYEEPLKIFRGQRQRSWPLESTLKRLISELGREPEETPIYEKILFSEFRRRFHQYSAYSPEPDDFLEWFSIMQHYGAPTRLLDWSHSVYVALYFALRYKAEDKKSGEPNEPRKSEDSVVWAIDSQWALKASKAILEKNEKKSKFTKHFINATPTTREKRKTAFVKLFLSSKPARFVMPMAPVKLTERITIQQSTFLYPGDIRCPFEENIKALAGWENEDHIVRLIIRPEKRLEFLQRLHRMNITEATLFPGLDGFARSLAVYHQTFVIDEEGKKVNPYFLDKRDTVWKCQNG
jgi:hypothetical protein